MHEEGRRFYIYAHGKVNSWLGMFGWSESEGQYTEKEAMDRASELANLGYTVEIAEWKKFATVSPKKSKMEIEVVKH